MSGRRQCELCSKNRAERFFVSEDGRVCTDCQRLSASRRARATRLRTRYGISMDEYDALFDSQDGRCAICKGTRRVNLDVDHDRRLEKALVGQGVPDEQAARRSVRGLLCRSCNRRLLPAAKDSTDLLHNAQSYLMFNRAQEVLAECSS